MNEMAAGGASADLRCGTPLDNPADVLAGPVERPGPEEKTDTTLPRGGTRVRSRGNGSQILMCSRAPLGEDGASPGRVWQAGVADVGGVVDVGDGPFPPPGKRSCAPSPLLLWLRPLRAPGGGGDGGGGGQGCHDGGLRLACQRGGEHL